MLTAIAGDELMFVAPSTSLTSLRLSPRVDSTPSLLALVHRQKTPGSLEHQERRFVLVCFSYKLNTRSTLWIHPYLCVCCML